jgi:hypothetical protein
MSDTLVTGSICKLELKSADPFEFYGFVFIKPAKNGDHYIVDQQTFNVNVKKFVENKIGTCLGEHKLIYGDTSGSYNIFLIDNKLVASLGKKSNIFAVTILNE